MATKQDLPVTDSAAVLHDLVGDDATAAFESDPTFIAGNPTADSSSENLQLRKDRGDFQNLPDIKAARIKALDEEEDEDDVEDEDEDDDDFEDIDTEDDEDDDDDDDDLDDDLEDDDDDEDDDDEDEDEDDE